MNRVFVLGSINIDISMETDGFPVIGETMLGGSVDYYMGGKGGNQAVAAARIGGRVSLTASVGGDTFGEKALEHLRAEGVDTRFVTVKDGAFTGIASIFRIHSDNAIIVFPGANMLLSETAELVEAFNDKDIFVAQLEVPLEMIRQGLYYAKKTNVQTIIDPAPFHADIVNMLDEIDIITPNETEFEGLIGHTLKEQDMEEAMLEWAENHDTQLIVTRGSQGVSYVVDSEVRTISAVKDIEVLDTTGAGDTFTGTLAAFLAEGMPYETAIETANICAALSTTKIGAQTGMPTRAELRHFK